MSISLAPVDLRRGPVFMILLGGFIGAVAGSAVIVVNALRPGALAYPASVIIDAFVFVCNGCIGLVSGLLGAGCGYLVMILFRRLHLPPAAGLLVGTAAVGEFVAFSAARDFYDGAQLLSTTPQVPVLVGSTVMTAFWVLVRRRRKRALLVVREDVDERVSYSIRCSRTPLNGAEDFSTESAAPPRETT